MVRAYSKSVKRMLSDKLLTAASTSAGFIIPDGYRPRSKQHGFQVFVRVCRYSEELLKEQPSTGGLLCEKTKR